MLAMSEAGFLAVVVAFAIAGRTAPDWSFASLGAAAAHLSGGAIWAIFVLGFLGFGVKAGLVPVNFWLPRCYTATPSIFIPVLAGVTRLPILAASYGGGIPRLLPEMTYTAT